MALEPARQCEGSTIPDNGHAQANYEVSRALLAYGFSTVGVERVTASVSPENVASIRVLEKLVMHPVPNTDGDSAHFEYEFAAPEPTEQTD